ncbi:MAG TPA: hypothetical protein PKE63_13210, partial [Lacibacter sp.]|nr:hypothetical protein [Lacibacter sp.]
MTTAPYPGFFRRKLQQLGFLLLLLQGPLLQGQAVTQPALYQVRFSLELRTRFAAVGLNAADTSLQGTVEGLMWMQPCAGRRVYCRFQRSAAVSLPMGPAASAEVQAVLETGFAFRQLPGGQVDSLYFSGPVPDAAIQVVQQLLEGWLLAPPTAADETVVLLSDGNAAAAYGMTHYNGDTASRQLVSLEEQAVFRLPTILHRHTVYRSTLTWKRTGPDNRMASVHGQLERTSKMNHRTLSVLTCSYDYTLLPKARLKGRPADACRSLSNATALPFYQPAKLQQLQEQRDRERAAAFSTATLLRLLNGLREDTPDATTEQLAELVRIAYVAEKDSLNQLTLLFTETAPESRRFKVLRSGIVAAATPAAQEALLACIRHYRR